MLWLNLRNLWASIKVSRFGGILVSVSMGISVSGSGEVVGVWVCAHGALWFWLVVYCPPSILVGLPLIPALSHSP